MKRITGYIAGKRIEARGGEALDVRNPYTEQGIAIVEPSTPGQVDAAVAAARSALEDWGALSTSQRAQSLERLRAAMEDERTALIETVTDDLGSPLRISELIHVGLPLTILEQQSSLVEVVDRRTELGNSIVSQVPVGVVAAVTPWNYPLHQVIAKVAPALLAGCTVVLKPSEVTPVIIDALIDLVDRAGLPPGVLNVVWGTGPTIGEALVGHPGVDFVSFTGSTDAGRRVAAVAGANLVPLALELGGKSASIVLRGAALEKAVRATVNSCFLNSGQTCNALTRLIVPAESLAEATEVAVAAAERFTLGDPRDPATRLGPLVSEAQRARVASMVERALAEGARAVTGPGLALPDRGFFVAPTVLADVARGSHIEQNEVFGPVLAIVAAKDAEDALAIANGTPYGLAGAVWGDPAEAESVARRVRAGMVDVNGGAFNPLAPFGGVRSSGYGRELGPYGVEEYLRPLSLQYPATA